MAVGADDEVAGPHYALLGQKGVLHAHAAHLVKMGDALLAGEVAHDLRLLGALDVLVRHVMVGHQQNALWVEHLVGNLSHRFDGDGGRYIIGQHEVEVALDKLPRHHLVQSRMGGQNLLRHSHGTRHGLSLRGNF